MKKPDIPENEDLRLRSVRQLGLLDSLPQESYDNITTLASEICRTPVALLTILDKDIQWFKSKKGLGADQTGRDVSFCGHAILEPNKVFEVDNALEDSRFEDNPLVLDEETHFRSYAGVPILNKQGLPLGTLCVINKTPKKLSIHQKKSLIALGKQVEILYEYHLQNTELKKAQSNQLENNKILREFAGNVSHDLKMPLANMIITSDIVKAKYASVLDEKGKEYLDYIKNSGLKLSEYITGLLEYYSEDGSKPSEVKEFFLNDLLEDTIDLLHIDSNCDIRLPEENLKIRVNRAGLGQIMMNLISNSLKYNDAEEIVINIECYENGAFYHFSVSDNGIGIPEENLEQIFELFTVINVKGTPDERGHGIGLSTVQKLVDTMNGQISVQSTLNKGTTFNFSLEKPTWN
ncbi:GAF domain-containing sensor histidine kinase [Christiangramia sp. OXR-203]|jgi:signal transduction histidine kinase|uniref:sensor histidine kinase n=1 Tax=Christiangramia sp. OXR-203 TaxID=3100176 RepID=UPI002AC8CF46|nr:GAF domain-containing sensor histidine kinase [Christiangramia sp. OXR-203]WPY99819.1 GAF domain-containing sensor histidine kinase [Christiangramia sp. OXR-203]